MALFLRGNIWWYEIRNSKIRIVKSTGFTKQDRKKAQAVYTACRLAVSTKPKKSVIESMLDSIYNSVDRENEFPIDSIWTVYLDWLKGKSKSVSPKTLRSRKSAIDSVVSYCESMRVSDVCDCTVSLARQFVSDRLRGKANKTIRNIICDISTVWEACSQIQGGIHNPWRAVTPDNDGSSRRRDIFSNTERESIFATCKEVGHDWYGVSLVACYTGLRYGDVAMLEWSAVDLDEGVIKVTPRKTKRHNVTVILPIAGPVAKMLQSKKSRNGFVFPEHAVKYVNNNQVSPTFANVLRAAGVTDGYHDFHSWRHTFRSMLAAAGVSDETARRMGGWTNIAMASHYDHDTHLPEMRAAVTAITSKS